MWMQPGGLEFRDWRTNVHKVLVVLAGLGLRCGAELTVESTVRGDYAVDCQVGPRVQPAGGSNHTPASVPSHALTSLHRTHSTATAHFPSARVAVAIGPGCR